MTCTLDHLAVSAETLQDGIDAVETALGLKLTAGGEHPHMGTHNRLLGLGPIYLEVIAIDPDAPPPGRPRWFDLDNISGRPRLTNWIARTEDLDAALALAPPGSGTPMDLARGDLTWRMAVPEDGKLPFSGAFPALIQWIGAAHPAGRLEDAGIRLRAFEIAHPDADSLRAALTPMFDPLPVSLHRGPPAFRAEFETPHGLRVLE